MFSLPTILLILAAIGVGATVIAILIAFRSAREARSAIFPIVREEETVRARRARVATFILSATTALFLGGWLATLRLPVLDQFTPANNQPDLSTPAIIAFATVTPEGSMEQVPSPTPPLPTPVVATNTPVPVPTLPPTNTPLPTPPPPPASVAAVVITIAPETALPTVVLPTATLLPPSPTSAPPTVTPTPSPLPTPTSTVTPIARVPVQGPRTPAPVGAKIGPIQFAAQITPNIEAVNPDTRFPQRTKSVYAVYPYSGMINGVDFAAVWYQNGAELWRDEQVWRWGEKAQFYSFLNPPGEGLYKLELYVNDTVVATGLFEIR